MNIVNRSMYFFKRCISNIVTQNMNHFDEGIYLITHWKHTIDPKVRNLK